MFTHRHAMTIEWGDCDPAGIVFYPRYFAMFDAAAALLLEAASGRTRNDLIRHYGILGWPMVDTHATFHATATYDDQIVIESRVMRLGKTSFEIAHCLTRRDVLCVETNDTRVWSRHREDGGIAAAPLPDDLRAALTREN